MLKVYKNTEIRRRALGHWRVGSCHCFWLGPVFLLWNREVK